MSATERPPEEQDHIDRFLELFRTELNVPEIDLAVEGIVDRIMGLSRRLRRTIDETLADFGLTHGEWSVLGFLRNTRPSERLSPGVLSKWAELSSGAMTNRLDRLEEAGLVRRLPDPKDRRGIQVELTAKGRRLWERAAAVEAEKESAIAAALDEDEKEQLNTLLRRLMLEFERRKGETA